MISASRAKAIGIIAAAAAGGLVAVGACSIGVLYWLGSTAPSDAGHSPASDGAAAAPATSPAVTASEDAAIDWANTRQTLAVLDCRTSWLAFRGTTVECKGDIATLTAPAFLDETGTRDLSALDKRDLCSSFAKAHIRVRSRGSPVAVEVMGEGDRPARAVGGLEEPLVFDAVAKCAGTPVPWVRVWAPGAVAQGVQIEATFAFSR